MLDKFNIFGLTICVLAFFSSSCFEIFVVVVLALFFVSFSPVVIFDACHFDQMKLFKEMLTQINRSELREDITDAKKSIGKT